MKKIKKDKDFIKSAYFEGGKAALEAYVKKELRYPKDALAAKIEGTVSVRYSVNDEGKVIDAQVISSLSHSCDEEALRLVRNLQFKILNAGKIKSRFSRKLHIHFRLPGSPAVLPTTKKVPTTPIGPAMTFQYQVVAKQTSPSSSPAKKIASYEIKINLPPVKKK